MRFTRVSPHLLLLVNYKSCVARGRCCQTPKKKQNVPYRRTRNASHFEDDLRSRMQATAATKSREIEHRSLRGAWEEYYCSTVHNVGRWQAEMVESLLFSCALVVGLGGQKAQHTAAIILCRGSGTVSSTDLQLVETKQVGGNDGRWYVW